MSIKAHLKYTLVYFAYTFVYFNKFCLIFGEFGCYKAGISKKNCCYENVIFFCKKENLSKIKGRSYYREESVKQQKKAVKEACLFVGFDE